MQAVECGRGAPRGDAGAGRRGRHGSGACQFSGKIVKSSTAARCDGAATSEQFARRFARVCVRRDCAARACARVK